MSKQFDELRAVTDVTFAVPPRTIQGLLGPNGAGKTTLMNLVTGHVKSTQGSVGIGEQTLTGLPPHRRARFGLARTFQIPHVIGHGTVADNLRLGSNLAFSCGRTDTAKSGSHAGAWGRAMEGVLSLMELEVGGTSLLTTRVAKLSTANWRLLEVLRALLARPRILLMDEPFAGLTKAGIETLSSAMCHVRDETGISIVLVEHNLPAVFACADRLVVMDNGSLVLDGAVGDPGLIDQTYEVFRSSSEDVAKAAAARDSPGVNRVGVGVQLDHSDRRDAFARSGHESDLGDRSKSLALGVIDVNAGYGQLCVVHDVSLGVGRSRAVGLIGPNGAGKTTLLQAISGITRRMSGEVWVDGAIVAPNDPVGGIASGIGSVIERRHLFPSLSVQENLAVAAWAAGTSRNATTGRIQATLELLPHVEPWMGRRAGSLSGGQQQLVALARALIIEPKILLLDEPTTGLSVAAIDEVAEALRGVLASGVSVLVAEQNLSFCEAVCGEIYALAGGHVVGEGTIANLEDLWSVATT